MPARKTNPTDQELQVRFIKLCRLLRDRKQAIKATKIRDALNLSPQQGQWVIDKLEILEKAGIVKRCSRTKWLVLKHDERMMLETFGVIDISPVIPTPGQSNGHALSLSDSLKIGFFDRLVQQFGEDSMKKVLQVNALP